MTMDLLLQAAFGDQATADAAWTQYCKIQDPQDANHRERALFPLIYRRHHPLSFAYKSVYRHRWYANQLHLSTLREVFERLEKAQIPPCLIGSAAMAFGFYEDRGLREIDRLELLVPKELLDPAKKCLHGFSLSIRGSLFFDGRIDPLFKRFSYRTIEIPPFPSARMVCSEDQLLLALFEGVMDPFAAYWIPDAITIVRCSRSFEWPYFIAQVRSLKLEWPIYRALLMLQKKELIEIPSAIRSLFEAYRPNSRERSYAKWMAKPDTRLKRIQLYWHAHCRNAASQNLFMLFCTFPRFVKQSKPSVNWWDWMLCISKQLLFKEKRPFA